MKNFGGILVAIGGGLASLALLLRRKNTPSVPPPYPKICNNDGGPSVGLSILVRPPSEELLRSSPIEMHIEGNTSLKLVCPSMEKQHDVPHTSVSTQWLDYAQVELERVGSSDQDGEAEAHVQARGDLQGTQAVKNEGEQVLDALAENDTILLEERIGDEVYVVQGEDDKSDDNANHLAEGELCSGEVCEGGDHEAEGENIQEEFTEADECEVELVAVEGELCTGDDEVERVGSSDRDGEADVQVKEDFEGTQADKTKGEEVLDALAEDDNNLLEECIRDGGYVVQSEDDESDENADHLAEGELCSGDVCEGGDHEAEGEDIQEEFTEADEFEVELVAVEGELCIGDDEVDEHERGGGECTRNDDTAEQEGQICLADVDEGHAVIDSLVVEGHGSTISVYQQPPTYSLDPTFNIPCNKVNATLTQIANQPILATKPMASSNTSSDQHQLSYVSAVPTEPKRHTESGQLSNALTSSHVPSILFGSMPAAPLCLDPLGTYPLASQEEYSVQPSTSVCLLDEKPTGSTHLQQCQLQCSLNESSHKAPLVPIANSPFMLEMQPALSGPFVATATGPYWLESNQMPYSIDTSWGPPGFTSLQTPPPLEVYNTSQQVAQFGQSLWPYAFLYPSHGPQLQVYDIDAQVASFGHIVMLYVGDAHISTEMQGAPEMPHVSIASHSNISDTSTYQLPVEWSAVEPCNTYNFCTSGTCSSF